MHILEWMLPIHVAAVFADPASCDTDFITVWQYLCSMKGQLFRRGTVARRCRTSRKWCVARSSPALNIMIYFWPAIKDHLDCAC